MLGMEDELDWFFFFQEFMVQWEMICGYNDVRDGELLFFVFYFDFFYSDRIFFFS